MREKQQVLPLFYTKIYTHRRHTHRHNNCSTRITVKDGRTFFSVSLILPKNKRTPELNTGTLVIRT